MHIGRTLPPAATPIGIAQIMSGVRGIIRGAKEQVRFQSELKEYFGVRHCFTVSSGKAAFALTLLALKEIYPGRDEVLIPAFTCYSVPSSVIRSGLRIRLCDLDPDSLDFDFTQLAATLDGLSHPRQADASPDDMPPDLENKSETAAGNSAGSTKRLLAIVPTHLYGFPADIPRLRTMIQDPDVTIIEDAAQAMGETWEGRKLGTIGDVGFFSLGRGKAFSTVEGGVILTDRDDIAAVLSRDVANLPGYGFWQQAGLILKAAGLMFFTHPLLFWIPRCMPFLRLGQTLIEPHFSILKMSPFQAGLAANWQPRLQEQRECRTANVRRWTKLLDESGHQDSYFQRSQLLGLLRIPVRIRNSGKRSWLLRESAQMGAGVMPVYPESINRASGLKGEIPDSSFPVAESYARELVTLPTHDYVTSNDVKVVRQLLSRALDGRGC